MDESEKPKEERDASKPADEALEITQADTVSESVDAETEEPAEEAVEASPAASGAPDEPDEPRAAELQPALEERKPKEMLVERPSRTRLYVVLGVVGVIALIAGIIVWRGVALTNEEETAWRRAESGGTEASWQGYIQWVDAVGEGGGLRALLARRLTSMEARAEAAAEAALEARAEEATANEDWEELCTIIREHADSAGATSARRGLQGRIERGILAYRHLSKRFSTPDDVVTAVTAALEAAKASPCGEGALIRVTHAIDRGDAFSDRVQGGKSVADVLGEVPLEERGSVIAKKVASELSAATGGALKARYAAADDDATGLLDIRVTSTFQPRDRFLTPTGRQLPGVALKVRVEASAPSLPAPSDDDRPPTEPGHASEATLPETFAMEFFRDDASASGEGLARAYGQAAEQLFPHVGEHMRRVLGLSRFILDTGSRGPCATPRPLQANAVVRGNTADGLDYYYGNCDEFVQEDYEDYGDDGDMPQQTELIYRLVVPTRSDVALGVESDFLPVLYVRRECRSIASEVACNDSDGQLETTLDEGVYYVFVDTSRDEVPGPFSLVAALRDPEQTARACSAAETLTVGSEASGTTAGGGDDFSGTCGGVGTPERAYTFDVPERSRLRCVQEGVFESAVYLRSQCADRTTEVDCVTSGTSKRATLATMVERGRHALFVDGAFLEERGSFELRCELAPPGGQDGAEADSCTAPGTIEASGTLSVDTFTARDDLQGSCGGAGAPDQVYRIDVPSNSRLRAWWGSSGFRGVLYLQSECGQREVACARAAQPLTVDVSAGTYYLVVDGSSATHFGDGRLAVELDDLEAICATGVPLRPGETVNGTIGNTPSRFRGSCAGSSDGSEVVHLLTLDRRSHVTLRARTTFGTVLYIRRTCTSQEVACSGRNSTTSEAVIDRELEPGHYYVFLDGQYSSRGPYELNVEVRPIQ